MQAKETFNSHFISKKSVIALAIAASTIISSGAHAAVDGESSDTAYVIVGNLGGNPGIGIATFAGAALVNAGHFAIPAVKDSNDVYQFSGKELVADYGAPGPGTPFAPDHSQLGIWKFKEVDSNAAEVWFGEWREEGSTQGTPVSGTHTVFYVGKDASVSSSLPASATYTVETIGNYTGTLPTSTFNATFGSTNTVTATASGNDIQFSSGTISASSASVFLSATGVSVASTGGSGGNLSGQFFGPGAEVVAGTVTFSDREKDVAFGGTR